MRSREDRLDRRNSTLGEPFLSRFARVANAHPTLPAPTPLPPQTIFTRVQNETTDDQ